MITEPSPGHVVVAGAPLRSDDDTLAAVLCGVCGGGLPFGELRLTQVPDHALSRTVDSGILHLLFLHFIVDPHLVRADDVLGIGNCA